MIARKTRRVEASALETFIGGVSAGPKPAPLDRAGRPPPTAGRSSARREKSPTGDSNDPINRENAALDRMTKGICRVTE